MAHHQHRRTLALVLLSFLLSAASCTGRRSGAPSSAPEKPSASRQPLAERPLSEAALMQELAKHCEDLKRRAGYAALAGRATVLLKAAERISLEHRSPGYHAATRELQSRVRALISSANPREAYTALLAACRSCHEQFAPKSMRQLDALRLAPITKLEPARKK